MMGRLRRLWYDFRNALELRSEYDMTLWDAWKIIQWCKPNPDIRDSSSAPDPDTLASWTQEARRKRRIAQ